ncbi:MAG: shufflon system plasmid conjugative transfer pilus tip adhesin PilV [Pseudomonadota bacterium]|nr:shufflon system plasmid conjugative transfer pilus tip adhesin PilV [Pseudomonadota bacterium]
MNEINGMKVRTRRKFLGATLMEALLAAGLTMTAIVAGSTAVIDSLDDMRVRSSAEHFKAVQIAVDRYVRANYDAGNDLMNKVPTQGSRFVISLSDLQNCTSNTNCFLPSSFNDTNPFDQNYRIVARRAPTGDFLEVSILTVGGNEIPMARVPEIAMRVGGRAGFTCIDEPGSVCSIINDGRVQVRGAYHSWRIDNYENEWGTIPVPNNLGSGRLASLQTYDQGALITDYLYRVRVPNHPEANRMYTDLNLGGFDVLAAGSVAEATDPLSEITGNSVPTEQGTFGELIAADLDASANAPAFAVTVTTGGSATITNPMMVDDVEVGAPSVIIAQELDKARCPAGYFLTRSTFGFKCVKNVLPPGTVVAWAGNPDLDYDHPDKWLCPDGWREFTEARGRFIMGVNMIYDKGPDGIKGTADDISARPLNRTAGEESHVISYNEMPAFIPVSGGRRLILRWGGYGGFKYGFARDMYGRQWGVDLVPPYLSLVWCRKIDDTDTQ